MYFTKIRLAGLYNVDLPIVGAKPSDIFVFKGADGLGPVEGDVSIATTLSQGGVYQNRRPQLLEPVIRVGLNPDYSVGQTSSGLRTQLYGLLTPAYGDVIKLQLMNDTTVVAELDGVVKRIEPSIFSKEPEAQITISGLSSYLKDPVPLYIPSLQQVLDGSYTRFTIQNNGNAPSGFSISFVFTAPFTSSFQLHSNADDAFAPIMSITDTWATGDMLSINTVAGNRGIYKTPSGGAQVSILNSLESGSPWLQLHGGANVMKVNCTAFDWGTVAVGYTPQYWGI